MDNLKAIADSVSAGSAKLMERFPNQDVFEIWGCECDVDSTGNIVEKYYYQSEMLSTDSIPDLVEVLNEILVYESEGYGFFVIEGSETKEVIGDIDDGDLEIFYDKCVNDGVRINLDELL